MIVGCRKHFSTWNYISSNLRYQSPLLQLPLIWVNDLQEVCLLKVTGILCSNTLLFQSVLTKFYVFSKYLLACHFCLLVFVFFYYDSILMLISKQRWKLFWIKSEIKTSTFWCKTLHFNEELARKNYFQFFQFPPSATTTFSECEENVH